MDSNKVLVEKIKKIGPWFHNIEVRQDVFTRVIAPTSGPQPVNHPSIGWMTLEPHLPTSMAGMYVLDVGSADGFYSVEFAKRGANVLAVDAAPKMIARVKFLAEEMGLPISVQVCTGEEMQSNDKFDILFNLGLLYHSRHPFLLLENLAKTFHKQMYLETIVADGDEPFLFLKPPQENVHYVPKWIPTKSCVIEMLKYLGYSSIEPLDYSAKSRFYLKAEKI